MTARGESRVAPVNPWRFLLLVVSMTWVFWVPATQLTADFQPWISRVLLVLGGVMPLAVTLLVVGRTMARSNREDFWARVVDGRRISPAWWAVLLLMVPVVTALAAILDVLTGSTGSGLGEPAIRAATQPLTLVPFFLVTLLFGPLPEEIAWRGYALDRMLNMQSALAASIWIGVVWAVWHLPLFWIADTYQHQLGPGSVAFWLYLAEMLPRSIIMTWIFVNTSRSTLAMILFHFLVNAVGELFELSMQVEVFRAALWLAAAVVVLWIWGHRTLAPETDEKSSGSGSHARSGD